MTMTRMTRDEWIELLEGTGFTKYNDPKFMRKFMREYEYFPKTPDLELLYTWPDQDVNSLFKYVACYFGFFGVVKGLNNWIGMVSRDSFETNPNRISTYESINPFNALAFAALNCLREEKEDMNEDR